MALEPPEGLTPGQEQLPAEGELDGVLSVWLRPAAVLSGQVQFALDSEMLSLVDVPVLGLTLTLLSVVDCANADPNAPITTAAATLTARCLTLMCSFSICRWGETTLAHASAVPPNASPSLGRIRTMSEHKQPHDMGGDEDGGAIDIVDHGMKFWEKQANALRNTLTSRKVIRLDELRRAAEDLGDRYYQLEYFERTTHALRQVLLEKGYFTEAELAAKMKEVRKRYES